MPLNEGRLLILSCFPPGNPRVTADLAARRNLVVAALAEDHWFAHMTPGGQSECLAQTIATWSST